jgi:hypothetical protein
VSFFVNEFLYIQKYRKSHDYAADWLAPLSAGRARRRRKCSIDFERLVGSEGWLRLAPAVRERFGHRAASPERFTGTMHMVEASAAGLILARLCRLIGTPFAPYRGRDVPVAIRLHVDRTGEGIVWDRLYLYPQRPPVLVTSTKRMADDGGLLECVGGGFGMHLKVLEADGALHFVSRRYFWRVAGWRVALPHLVSPGLAHVTHADIGGGRFRFTMTIRHRWFGLLFHQDGIFSDDGGPP